jgi:hypothetical protein
MTHLVGQDRSSLAMHEQSLSIIVGLPELMTAML